MHFFELRLPAIGFTAAGRYVVLAASGELYVRSVRAEDGLVKFSCLVTNTLNGDRQRSDAVVLQVKGKMKSIRIEPTIRLLIQSGINVRYRAKQEPGAEHQPKTSNGNSG